VVSDLINGRDVLLERKGEISTAINASCAFCKKVGLSKVISGRVMPLACKKKGVFDREVVKPHRLNSYSGRQQTSHSGVDSAAGWIALFLEVTMVDLFMGCSKARDCVSQ
jgi:hypothetical protein